MSRDKATDQSLKPRSVSPRPGFFPLLPTASLPALFSPSVSTANSQMCHWREKVRKHCSGQSLQGLSTVSSFLSCYYGVNSAGSTTTSRSNPCLCHLSCSLTAPIFTLSQAPQDLSFQNLSQNIILQGHSPTLKGKVPRGKEIKLLWLNSTRVQRHLVVLGPMVPGGDIFKQSISHH